MNTDSIINLVVDVFPFLMYSAVLFKVWQSWSKVKVSADAARRHRMAAILILFSVVVICLLGANAYAFVATGKTYLSIRGFQIFLVGNCIVYWLVIDILTKDSIPEQGHERESAG